MFDFGFLTRNIFPINLRTISEFQHKKVIRSLNFARNSNMCQWISTVYYSVLS